MSHEGKTELRVEVPTIDLATIDGHCNATGKSRTDLVRVILGEWSEAKRHEAMVICRVAGINPFASDTHRSNP